MSVQRRELRGGLFQFSGGMVPERDSTENPSLRTSRPSGRSLDHLRRDRMCLHRPSRTYKHPAIIVAIPVPIFSLCSQNCVLLVQAQSRLRSAILQIESFGGGIDPNNKAPDVCEIFTLSRSRGVVQTRWCIHSR